MLIVHFYSSVSTVLIFFLYTEISITKLQSWVDECTAPEGNNIMSDCEAQNAQPNPSEYNKIYEEAKRIALMLGVQESFPRAVRRQVQQLAQFAEIKDYYKKQLFLPFLTMMIEQLETRLVRTKPHFKAIWLLPSNLDFNLTDLELSQKLCDIFLPESPYYDDIVKHGNIYTYEKELDHWISHWKQASPTNRPKHTPDCPYIWTCIQI